LVLRFQKQFNGEGRDVEKSASKREQNTQTNGATGHGYLRGQSGNLKGRPNTKGLVTVLHNKVAEIGPDGKTVEEQLVDVLVHEALRGKHRLAAVQMIFDRLEERAHQQIAGDNTRELGQKSDEELRFYPGASGSRKTDLMLRHRSPLFARSRKLDP
jgi:hypothetical protein